MCHNEFVMSILRTLFTPHPHNNHKATFLHKSSLVVLIGIYLIGRSLIDFYAVRHPGVLGFASQINPQRIVELTNQYRTQSGLTDLKLNQKLNEAALAKATDMFNQNYWAHVSPTGTEPWSFIAQVGYEYRHAGENLARDFSNPDDTVKAWMNSPTHRQNILDSRYEDIGIAVLDGYINGIETTLVVQMFGTPQTSVGQISAKQIVNQVSASGNKKYPTPSYTPLQASRSWSLAFIVAFIFLLLFDWLFIWKNNIVRVSGKTWAHLTFFITLLIITVIIKQGLIL